MLIGLLIAALVAMSVSSSPGNFFLVPDIKKEIKKSVEDPERKADLIALTKIMSKEIKAFQKFNKPYLKQIPVVNKDRSAKRTEIQRLFNESYDERKKLQVKLVEGTLRFQELCTEVEWNGIIDAAYQPNSKQQIKLYKAKNKIMAADQKPLDKIRAEIEMGIEDKERLTKALNAFDDFEVEMQRLLEHIREMDTKHHKTLKKYGVIRRELEKINQEQNRIREGVYKEFIDMHFEMVEATTEVEWKSISNAIDKIFD